MSPVRWRKVYGLPSSRVDYTNAEGVPDGAWIGETPRARVVIWHSNRIPRPEGSGDYAMTITVDGLSGPATSYGHHYLRDAKRQAEQALVMLGAQYADEAPTKGESSEQSGD